MPNILIMGAGRSGTSMIAGSILSATPQFWTGDHPVRARSANPLGFFEDRRINSLNESVLRNSGARFPSGFNPLNLARGRRLLGWLSILEPAAPLLPKPSISRAVNEVADRSPLLIKDPRLMYTSRLWLTHVPKAKVVVAIRKPSAVLQSTLNEVHAAPYLAGYRIDANWVAAVWLAMYRRFLLERGEMEHVVVDFDDFLDSACIRQTLAGRLGVQVADGFPSSTLRRSEAIVPTHLSAGLYSQMCSLYEELGKLSI